MVQEHVRLAHLLLAPLLACTAPNPAYVSRDARVEWPEVGGMSDTPRGDAAPDTARVDGSAVVDGAAGTDGPPGADAPGGADAPIGPVVAGLVLHWRFDETAGSTALDASGHGLEGTYSGTPPSPSIEVPPTSFANPSSRRFDGTVGNSVQVASMPAALQPTQGVTVAVWFRTTQTTRADLVSQGNNYFIRWNIGELQFVRRRPLGSSTTFVAATALTPTANDGSWHHAAGVASVDGDTSIYLDGVLLDADVSRLPFTYANPSTFVAGQSMAGGQIFDGWMDDLRVYDRVLSADEIRALARGEP